jgi:hypothetical protein
MKLNNLFTAALIACHAVSPAAGLPASTEPAPVPSPAAADYATTTTVISSTTESSTSLIQFINPRVVTIITTITATTLRPGPVTSFPATVVETVVSHITFEFRTSYTDGGRTTSMSSAVVTVPATWIVAAPRPTDLAAGTTADELPCSADGCTTEVQERTREDSDPRCDALGLQTGCQGQCEEREGAWWCYQLYLADYRDAKLRMGRACWGADNRYEQLNSPCVASDRKVACTACGGLDDSWGALNWTGPADNP